MPPLSQLRWSSRLHPRPHAPGRARPFDPIRGMAGQRLERLSERSSSTKGRLPISREGGWNCAMWMPVALAPGAPLYRSANRGSE